MGVCPEEPALCYTAATFGEAIIVSPGNAGLILSNKGGEDTPKGGGEAFSTVNRTHQDLDVPSFIRVFFNQCPYFKSKYPSRLV